MARGHAVRIKTVSAAEDADQRGRARRRPAERPGVPPGEALRRKREATQPVLRRDIDAGVIEYDVRALGFQPRQSLVERSQIRVVLSAVGQRDVEV